MVSGKKKAMIIVTVIALALAGIVGYRIYSNMKANTERAGRVAQGQVVAVEVAAIARRDVTPVLTFSSNLEPVWSAEIASKVDGRIDRLLVDEGDGVADGMTVAILDMGELSAQVVQAEGNLLQARATLEQAEMDLSRMEQLAKQGAIANQTLDSARTKRELAAGQVRAAEGALALYDSKLAGANVIAPRAGVVVKRYLQSGYYAKAGTPIIAVADISTLLAKATVGEAEIAQLAVGTKVKVKMDALAGQEFAGTITRLSPVAVMPSRTFTAEISIPNPQSILKGGMFAKVEVPGQVHAQALVVPETALVMREDIKTVYVLTADNKVQQRVLKLGYVGDGWAEVLDGVNDGEQIVISGQNKLRDGSTVRLAAPGEAGK
ncbi:efflux RND transporter periplasmic adaptor subunit [Sporomusa acidovorans]|uniref:Multidrug resistance protein MdtA n=1 Tax=Sporomusa acidovorans (strain ATCC 49682 / DSM 3132 / Mol) TaxID=1123286 RepID=A0ABZ3J258_SPOA4|nr:efflux RND transporter periplasmic adaptor subunit [Sporomusa acidovorans]OZC15036.1 macrolide export protein MacA [Sporomusa acidovorans DSM 3132]SDE84447.1 RND family efflux transporter, MFP subunit [Sporomusa acidovorans]